MWAVSARDVIALRGHGGELFTQFVDTLIRAESFVSGGLPADIRTNQRQNIADGGVDTELQKAFPRDSTGWFDRPTCWQYKSGEYANTSDAALCQEVKKAYAIQLLRGGYGYRFCICDDMPPEKKDTWETLLNTEIRSLNNGAPPCKVLTAGDFAAWASRFPAIIVRFFRPAMADVLHFNALERSISEATPEYVEVPDWQSTKAALSYSLDLSNPVPDVVSSLHGMAGVGKTRLACEILKSVPGATELVVYTTDETVARNISATLAVDEQLRAIIIADECSPESREQLRRRLNGCRTRVRVLTIDNFPDRNQVISEVLTLDRMSDEIVSEILQANFPAIPSDRRRQIIHLAGGFLRVAVDRAKYGGATEARPSLYDYLRTRLSDDDLRVIEAISLVQRIGFRDDMAHELTQLAAWTNIDRIALQQAAARLKESPGFVVQAGRYFYVTPEPIASIAFDLAWRRFTAGDPEEFLSRIPEALIDHFHGRVSQSARDEVRAIVGRYFFVWTDRLKPPDLFNLSVVERLTSLAETEPKRYLPIIRDLVEAASQDELSRVHGHEYGERWGPRRRLVWLAEKLAIFPDLFDDAEAILFHLALEENEPHIGNNATRIWTRLFSVYLSGSSLPFLERLQRLAQRIEERTEQQLPLLLGALKSTISSRETRIVPPPVIAGRIVPNDWQPRDRSEWIACYDAAIALMESLTECGDPNLRDGVIWLAVDQLRQIIVAGQLGRVIRLIEPDANNSAVLPRLLEAIDSVIAYDADRLSPESLAQVTEWRTSLVPSDLHGRLVATIGVDPWHHSRADTEDNWNHEIDTLAAELRANQSQFDAELQWLSSLEARSAGQLGLALGRLDNEAQFADRVIRHAARGKSTMLARGYISTLVREHPACASIVNRLLDELQESSPAAIFDMALVGEHHTRAIERALNLISTGTLPPDSLHGLLYGGYWQRIPTDQFKQLLSVVLPAIEDGNANAGNAALMLVAFRIDDVHKHQAEDVFQDSVATELVFRLLEATIDQADRNGHWWYEIAKHFTTVDPQAAIRLICHSLVTERYGRESAVKLLTELSDRYPDLVMTEFGSALLQDWQRHGIQIERFDQVLTSVPLEVVKKWLDVHGADGARSIARHLPKPYLDGERNPIVPQLTEYVLSNFENDDRVFESFISGAQSHGVMSGDIAGHFDGFAEIAEMFRTHRLRRVREWAQEESRMARGQADFWRRIDEEDHF